MSLFMGHAARSSGSVRRMDLPADFSDTCPMRKITPFLWFDNQAEEAAKFYVSIFKNSKMAGRKASAAG